ncbi:hypothetical protein [Lyngbya sp. PCC 8106]|uniref:hypothetical protein n=1 Tax=Lyngbya sp. (strain PCC 8106) TaxID=313612 RepID=UPI0000EAC410|nr:hypothetical protein [Lyngbya sp. PCC 8106]EAW38438.1 hypothetical protein L8106_06544 [Lyngbya sp. PCC 8106]
MRFFLTLATVVTVILFGNSLSRGEVQRSSAVEQSHESHGEGMNHNHEPMEIPQGQPIPTVDLVVHPDQMKGWNLEVKVSNFRFAPEQVNTDARPGEGHAHLYVNGEKITRIYGNWYYLDTLEPGQNQLRVNLNSNDHKQLVHQGQPIEDVEVIEADALAN